MRTKTCSKQDRRSWIPVVYVPAKWDKEPTKLENGKIQFPKDAKMAFMTAASQDGTKMFPVFTSVAEMKNAFGEPGVNCLLLSSERVPADGKKRERRCRRHCR